MCNKLTNTGLEDKVAQTLFIPLYLKAQESLRPDAFFSDPIACQLISDIDYDFSFFKESIKSSVGCAIRSQYFDAKVADFIGHHEECVIVNLGCGLDSRYERVCRLVDSNAAFYHLDLPEVIDFRETILASSEHDISVKGSLFETDWMDLLNKRHPNANFIFVVEGVFMYFDKTKLQSVLIEMAQRFKGSEILFDATNQWMCDNSHRHDSLKYTGVRFQLGLDDSYEIESWDKHLKLLSTKYYSDFEEWRRAGWLNYYMLKLIPTFRKASYMVHCSIG